MSGVRKKKVIKTLMWEIFFQGHILSTIGDVINVPYMYSHVLSTIGWKGL
jgi:hypothetical protein